MSLVLYFLEQFFLVSATVFFIAFAFTGLYLAIKWTFDAGWNWLLSDNGVARGQAPENPVDTLSQEAGTSRAELQYPLQDSYLALARPEGWYLVDNRTNLSGQEHSENDEN